MKVIVELRGGLGNQLFCYAFGYAIAKQNGAQLLIDSSMNDSGIQRDLEIQKFKIQYLRRIAIRYAKNKFLRLIGYNYIRRKFQIGLLTKTYSDEECYISFKKISIKHSTYFRGYWQNYRFFEEYRKEIQDMMKFVDKPSAGFDKWLRELEKSNSVSVHIRRGDYITLGWQLNEQYYIDAINDIISNNINTKLYIFSDDLEYCKQFINKYYKDIEVSYVEYESDNRTVEDLILMSHCKQMILANSSYSWWAAYLNKKSNPRIICPVYKQWKESYYPDEWEKVKVSY